MMKKQLWIFSALVGTMFFVASVSAVDVAPLQSALDAQKDTLLSSLETML